MEYILITTSISRIYIHLEARSPNISCYKNCRKLTDVHIAHPLDMQSYSSRDSVCVLWFCTRSKLWGMVRLHKAARPVPFGCLLELRTGRWWGPFQKVSEHVLPNCGDWIVCVYMYVVGGRHIVKILYWHHTCISSLEICTDMVLFIT